MSDDKTGPEIDFLPSEENDLRNRLAAGRAVIAILIDADVTGPAARLRAERVDAVLKTILRESVITEGTVLGAIKQHAASQPGDFHPHCAGVTPGSLKDKTPTEKLLVAAWRSKHVDPQPKKSLAQSSLPMTPEQLAEWGKLSPRVKLERANAIEDAKRRGGK